MGDIAKGFVLSARYKILWHYDKIEPGNFDKSAFSIGEPHTHTNAHTLTQNKSKNRTEQEEVSSESSFFFVEKLSTSFSMFCL